MPPITCGQTWLFQPLPMSTVPNTGRNQSDSGYRGLDEEGDSDNVEVFLVNLMNYMIHVLHL